MEEDSDQAEWSLEGYLDDSEEFRRWMVRPLPFRVGRNPDMDLCLPYSTISGRHAELFVRDNTLQLRDLESTNGTFLNREKISGEASLKDGDILHFSEYEFRLNRVEPEVTDLSRTVLTHVSSEELPEQLVVGKREFHQMLKSHAVLPFFQPIVKISGEETMGYEVLGRGDQPGVASVPDELFRIAARFGLEADLSRVFRSRGIQEARKLEGTPKLFVNTHPAELGSPQLLASLKKLRLEEPDLSIVLEIHEAAVTDLNQMRELRNQLTALDMGLAYDDFGAGQARLLELVEVPPDYLKFDLTLIRDLHEAPFPKQKLVETLVKMVGEIGVSCLAEGIEKKEEQQVCVEMGFDFAQGYLFGKPGPLSAWIRS